MPKRTSDVADLTSGSAKSTARGQETARAPAVDGDAEMGEFEDRWEDDIESDGEVVDAGPAEDDEEDGGELLLSL
jgi:ribosome assembly protein RRB1